MSLSAVFNAGKADREKLPNEVFFVARFQDYPGMPAHQLVQMGLDAVSHKIMQNSSSDIFELHLYNHLCRTQNTVGFT